MYCVSVTGVTGARTELPTDLAALLRNIKQRVTLPVAVGFGISTREHVDSVGRMADGVVMGSAVVAALRDGGVAGMKEFLAKVVPPRQ